MWGEAAVNSRKGGCTVQGPHSYLECKFPPACHQSCLEMFPDQEAEADPRHDDPRARSTEPLWGGILLEALGTCQAEDCHVETGGY